MTRLHQSLLVGAAAAVAFGLTALTAPTAQAAFSLAASGSGNVCTGVTGTFPNCDVIDAPGIDVSSPLIAKYEYVDPVEDDGVPGSFVFEGAGTQYASIIDGTEFSFSGFGEDPTMGVWNYMPDIGEDPFVTHYGLKFGQNWQIYAWIGDGTGGFGDMWSLDQGLSNITFFDTGVVPLPAAGWMMLGGLGMIGAALRRRRLGAASA
jgi:hypothetical protein